jgi:hypothetical protein
MKRQVFFLWTLVFDFDKKEGKEGGEGRKRKRGRRRKKKKERATTHTHLIKIHY